MEIKINDNIMKENWERWEPIQGLANKYYIVEIYDLFSGFKIILQAQETRHKVQVIFENPVDSYQLTDETYRYKKTIELANKYGDDILSWTFFKVTNSEYINWLSEQSYGISDNRGFKHFAFITANHQLDVITPCDPIKVEFIKDPFYKKIFKIFGK